MRFIVLIAALLFVSAGWADTTDSFDLRKLRALQSAQKHESEAESALRTLLQEQPADKALLFQLGLLMSDKAQQLDEGTSRKKFMLEARKYFLEANNLGFRDPLLVTALAAINEDGSENVGSLSSNATVDQILHKAEDAYAHHQFDKAIESYKAALKIQPANYLATLNLGDAYFASGSYPDAIDWFKKAIALDPNRETAYRYCGDALLKLGRKDDALDEFLSAIIAEPYNGYPWRGLQSGMRVFLLKPRQAAEKAPNADVTEGAKGPELHISDPENLLQFSYAMARADWHTKYKATRFPSGAPYRMTLEEEVYGLNSLLKVYAEMKASSKTSPKYALAIQEAAQSMDELAEINAAGLLEAHVLFFRANKDIAIDYAAYRDQNRERLRTYLIKYYLHIL